MASSISKPIYLTAFATVLQIAICLYPTPAAGEKPKTADQIRREVEKSMAESRKRLAAPKTPVTTGTVTTGTVQPAFNASKAPKPEVSFNSYLQAVRGAKSMDTILPYLPESERKLLVERQQQFDPKQAQERRQRYKTEGQLDEEAIIHLTSSPYENEFKFRKSVAGKIEKFVSSKVEGNKATLQVTILVNSVVNGVAYPYSTATIGLTGEGDKWYYTSYSESNWVSRTPIK